MIDRQVMPFDVDPVGRRVRVRDSPVLAALAAVDVCAVVDVLDFQVHTEPLPRLCLQRLQQHVALIAHGGLRLDHGDRQPFTLLAPVAGRVARAPAGLVEQRVGELRIVAVGVLQAVVV